MCDTTSTGAGGQSIFIIALQGCGRHLHLMRRTFIGCVPPYFCTKGLGKVDIISVKVMHEVPSETQSTNVRVVLYRRRHWG